MANLISSGSSPLNNLRNQHLSILTGKQTRQLIAFGFPDGLDPDVESFFFQLTGKHPYLLQGLLEKLWEEKEEGDRNSLKRAVRDFLREHHDFSRWLDAFDPAGHAVYQLLTDLQTGHYTSATSAAACPKMSLNSYSHRDEEHREDLEEHLSLLKTQGLIDAWHDRQIGAGQEWQGAIDENLEAANVILLLGSSSFLASPYCRDIEMKRALEKHEAGEARVMPIIIRAVDWKGAPFGKLQALPKNAEPVTSWPNRDEAWVDVARGIRKAVEELRQGQAQ